ncbi:MAG: helix-turn-helix domain-containing protein [Ruminococcus sp.]
MENVYVSSEIAARIKFMAKQKNVTVYAMLEAIELGKNTMANFKTSMPKADNLAKIADYLDCSVDYLLGRTDEPHVNIKKICNNGNNVAFGDRCNNNSIEVGNVKEHAESEAKNEDEELLQLFHALPIYLRAKFILAMHNKVIEQQKKSDEWSDD